jgi:hypothetical protein
VITNNIYEKIYNLVMNPNIPISQIIDYIFEISIQYNQDKHSIINNYSNYLIINKPEIINTDFLYVIETVIHSLDTDIKQLIFYFLEKMRKNVT